MGMEVDLLANYPSSPRDVSKRGAERTEEDRLIARRFDREFFDGDRRYGYGGYRYHPRFWQPVVPAFVERYGLRAGSRVLDVGCAKGFFLHDLQAAVPGISVVGLDISPYAVDRGKEEVRNRLMVGHARDLPFPHRSFDLVIALTTLHNLFEADLRHALSEIERVGRGRNFITLDAYRNDDERRRIEAWNLTARTVHHVDDWRRLFADVGFQGDYYWFIP